MNTLEKIIAKCKAAGACQRQFKKLVACSNLKEACVVLEDNMDWVCRNNILYIEDWRELLESGVDCTANDNFAIGWASANGHVEVVKLLLEHGADCTSKHNHPICLASYYGHTEVVKLLLEHGSYCEARDNEAIRLAAYKSHTKIVELLMQHGATL